MHTIKNCICYFTLNYCSNNVFFKKQLNFYLMYSILICPSERKLLCLKDCKGIHISKLCISPQCLDWVFYSESIFSLLQTYPVGLIYCHCSHRRFGKQVSSIHCRLFGKAAQDSCNTDRDWFEYCWIQICWLQGFSWYDHLGLLCISLSKVALISFVKLYRLEKFYRKLVSRLQ